ncbi:MBG domain-containing protein, partial [Klebsiella pneumoniae]|uniref:MBG domain-containing protein n=1 Tax=Klebsiella pneumoniae TaxID=573 RepID=UPI0038539829
ATGLVNGNTLAGVTTGTAAWGTTATTASGVGSYGVTGSGLSGTSANYTFNFVQAAANATALKITPAALTVTYTATPVSQVYGAATPIL